MVKYILAYLIMLSFPFCIAQSVTPEQDEQISFQETTASVDDLFMTEDLKELQPPVFQTPSLFMIWLRTFGVALVYKYYAVKDWFLGNYSNFMHSTARSP